MGETAHQAARRRRRRTVERIAEDGAYGVEVRSRGRLGFELRWKPSPDPLVALAQLYGLDEHVEQIAAALIWDCRRQGLSWDDVAGVMGYSRPAVQKRYGAAVRALEEVAP